MAWDVREKEFDALRSDISELKTKLTSDPEWLKEITLKVKAEPSKESPNVLKQSLISKILSIEAIRNASADNKGNGLENSVINSKPNGSDINGTSGDKDSANFIGSLVNGLGGGRIM